jgi:hypothetical protein
MCGATFLHAQPCASVVPSVEQTAIELALYSTNLKILTPKQDEVAPEVKKWLQTHNLECVGKALHVNPKP